MNLLRALKCSTSHLTQAYSKEGERCSQPIDEGVLSDVCPYVCPCKYVWACQTVNVT